MINQNKQLLFDLNESKSEALIPVKPKESKSDLNKVETFGNVSHYLQQSQSLNQISDTVRLAYGDKIQTINTQDRVDHHMLTVDNRQDGEHPLIDNGNLSHRSFKNKLVGEKREIPMDRVTSLKSKQMFLSKILGSNG